VETFNDYDFLAKYVRNDNILSVHQLLAAEIVTELQIKSVLDIGGGTLFDKHIPYVHLKSLYFPALGVTNASKAYKSS
jgi:hypothetical protein